MPGEKVFTNHSDKHLDITLFVRLGDNPANRAGTQSFSLNPGQSSRIAYGNDTNIYLNGFSLVSTYNGEVYGEQEFVIIRGNALDNQLNMNSIVEIYYDPGRNDFYIQTHN